MNKQERIRLFEQVFSPKQGERILILTDEPHGDISDNESWIERRKMANDWYLTFKEMSGNKGYSVETSSFPATGMNNMPISDETKKLVRRYNLVIAMTEFSATSSLAPMRLEKNLNFRCASMPGVERRMEDTSLRADYSKVQQYSLAIEQILKTVVSAEIDFSNGDHLLLDLRNRKPLADLGDCTKSGQTINLPSGETCIVPYEAVDDEKVVFGSSKSKGILPVKYDDGIVRYHIEENKISRIDGCGNTAEKMNQFFEENNCRRNIAELGIGCNPQAVVTGNVLEDEKVPGLHIAYGMSSHIGGKVSCDVHQDICYPKKAPIQAVSLMLIHNDDHETELINEQGLRFELINQLI